VQALERHQAQQRLWANSAGSTVDAGQSPGTSPRGGGGHPSAGNAAGAAGFSAGGLLAAQQQLLAAAHAASSAKDAARLPAANFMV
jgi:hypothetical protein